MSESSELPSQTEQEPGRQGRDDTLQRRREAHGMRDEDIPRARYPIGGQMDDIVRGLVCRLRLP